jgi:hypothetical protein
VDPEDLVERLLEDNGEYVYKLIFELGEEDVDVAVHYHTELTTAGDNDYQPGYHRVKIDDIIRNDTGESIKKTISQDQFYDLLSRTEDYNQHDR